MMKINNGNINLVNCVSDRYIHVNNCGIQTRTNNFTVFRSEGWKDYHILLIISGKALVYFNDKEYTLLPGGVVFYAPKEPQKYIFPKECVSLWIHFSGYAVKEILEDSFLLSGVYQLTPDTYLNELFYGIINNFNKEKTKKYTNSSLIEMIYYISDKNKNSEFSKYSSNISKATGYMNKNYEKDISLGELAKISGYSKSRFSYLFKEYVGCTPVEYQRNIRLNSSCVLLCSTDLSVGEIAFKCGYNDPIYFSKLFKRKYGLSPRQYKNENK